MKHSFAWILILTLSFLPDISIASDSIELDARLIFLKPLIGQHWEGGYVGDDAPDLMISLRFEPVLSGKAVKYTREAAEVGFFSETHFYWSPNRKEVLFISLNSRGIVGEGVVSLQDGDILLLGENHLPEGSMEFKTLLHLDEDGVLKDTFTRREKGEWVHGHFQEFVTKD